MEEERKKVKVERQKEENGVMDYNL